MLMIPRLVDQSVDLPAGYERPQSKLFWNNQLISQLLSSKNRITIAPTFRSTITAYSFTPTTVVKNFILPASQAANKDGGGAGRSVWRRCVWLIIVFQLIRVYSSMFYTL